MPLLPQTMQQVSLGNKGQDPECALVPSPARDISCLAHILTQGERSLLAKGPNHAITPRHSPNLEYISAIESVYPKLSQQEAE